MTRFGKVTLGVLTVLALAGVTLCNGQSQARAAWPTEHGPDTQVALSSDGQTITVSRPVAILSRAASKATPFTWAIGTLPDGDKLEIDFRVQGARKGPFTRPEQSKDPQGRYTATANQTIAAGPLPGEGREVWKYDVILRDKDGNHKTAIDPAVIIME